MKISRVSFLTLLVFFNSLPVYGVFNWNWSSFDIIFLYWCENLIIGLFMILRIVIRTYSHPVELIFPVFMAPFFTFHYGLFSYVHGTILIQLFGADALGELAKLGIPDVILPVIETRQLFWPLAALFAYQLLDWIRDTSERGLGSDSIKDLTTAPYKRILILHFTLILSGFALNILNQPTTGLLLLIVLKTGYDIFHFYQDEKKSEKQLHPVMSKSMKAKLDDFIENPKISVNGKDIHFDNYEALKTSKHYRLMQTLFNMTNGNNDLKMAEEYIETRIKEKQDQYPC